MNYMRITLLITESLNQHRKHCNVQSHSLKLIMHNAQKIIKLFSLQQSPCVYDKEYRCAKKMFKVLMCSLLYGFY